MLAEREEREGKNLSAVDKAKIHINVKKTRERKKGAWDDEAGGWDVKL